MAELSVAVESKAEEVGTGDGADAFSGADAGAPLCSVAAKIAAAATRKIAPKRISGHGLDGGWFSGSGGSGAMKESRKAQRPHK